MTAKSFEILHHKQVRNMKYKVSYFVYKMKAIWPVLDKIAAYFYFIVNITVLVFALYFQIAIFWAIALTIYMISQFFNWRTNFKYRQEERQCFYSDVEEKGNCNI